MSPSQRGTTVDEEKPMELTIANRTTRPGVEGRYIGYAGSMATMIFPLWAPDRMRAYALSASLKGKT